VILFLFIFPGIVYFTERVEQNYCVWYTRNTKGNKNAGLCGKSKITNGLIYIWKFVKTLWAYIYILQII
jgi:hypothetical protein